MAADLQPICNRTPPDRADLASFGVMPGAQNPLDSREFRTDRYGPSQRQPEMMSEDAKFALGY
jgi:hypothetical protein